MTTVNSHYVPVFLLKNWVVKTDKSKQDNLISMSWHKDANRIVVNHSKGPKGYCTVEEYLLPRESPFPEDMIETQLFTPIDTKASISLKEMESQKTTKREYRTNIINLKKLDQISKQNFIVFILSLMSRAPHVMSRTISDKDETNRRLDGNREMLEYFAKENIKLSPSEWVRSIGLTLEKMSLFLSYSHVQNKQSRISLLNKDWNIIDIEEEYGSFILSDTPIFTNSQILDRNSILYLPITPQKVLIIANNLEKTDFYSKSPQQKVKMINKTSALISMRYIFTIDKNYKNWLGKYLKDSIGFPKNVKMKN